MVYWFYNILFSLDVINMVFWFKVYSNFVFFMKKNERNE